MCSGDVRSVVALREEWSPIREAPAPQAIHRFPPDEPDASSDMDTDDDAVPLVKLRENAASTAYVGAGAVDVAWSDVVVGDVFPDCAKGGFMISEGEPAPKRKRLPELGKNPVVQVIYEGLTRESKTFLQQTLQTWSYWHSRSYPSGMEAREEVLQSGTEVYSPALILDPSSNIGTISVWVDKPLKDQKGKVQDRLFGSTLDKEKDVPLYDRTYISALSSQDLSNADRYYYVEPDEAFRCFNCASYSHSLRDCPRPHSMAAIRSARDALSNKRGPRARTASRYYQFSPGGKFDDLKAGVLGPEARKAIGIGELDPPPWLNRMREIGYPPGYLESLEDESSGVQIIDDETEVSTGKESKKDGAVVENLIHIEEQKTGQKMIVEFPGINARIPENADKKLWAAFAEPKSMDSSRGRKRPYQQIIQMQKAWSGLFSPNIPEKTWAASSRDINLRCGSPKRCISSGNPESYSRPDSLELYPDVNRSTLSGSTSSVLNRTGSLSVDPGYHWSTRRVNGKSSGPEGKKSPILKRGMQDSYQIPLNSVGVASPVRGMFHLPNPGRPFSSPPHVYSHHSYDPSRPQGSFLAMSQISDQTANQAWLKAQSALDALQSTESSGGVLAARQGLGGSLQNSRGPGLSQQPGRMQLE